MIPSRYRYETIVGLFVVLSLAALFVMVVIIARQEGLFQENVQYLTIFKNVSGLKPGSEVHLAGVTVGTVKHITISSAGNTEVTFQVFKKYGNWIREDTQASIGFMGLLGDKSLDLTVGSAGKAAIPPGGVVASIEPLDITQLLARAGPSLENLQAVLQNLAKFSNALMGKEGELVSTVDELKGIFTKINRGQGSLGLIVNDPKLYQEATRAMGSARKVLSDAEQGKGALGTLIHDPKFKARMEQTMAHLDSTLANFKEATGRLPEISRKLDEFMTNLDKAGKGLPGLVTSGESLAEDADKTARAANKSWLLRGHVPKPQEHTIRMDAGTGKD